MVPAGHATVIVCMGDTVTHLPGKSDVSTLFRAVFDTLILAECLSSPTAT
jgi:hypothetical protein